MEAVEAVRFAGGIWLLWDSTRVHVESVTTHDQILTILVADIGHNKTWLFSIIFASPNPLLQDELWKYLGKMGNLVHILLGPRRALGGG